MSIGVPECIFILFVFTAVVGGGWLAMLRWLSSAKGAVSDLQDRLSMEKKTNDVMNQRVESLELMLKQEQRQVTMVEQRMTQEYQRVDAQVDRMREKWEEFSKKNAVMEATRGRKVDALFEVVDSVKGTVREIAPTLERKLDEMYQTMKTELEHELRTEPSEELPGGSRVAERR